MPKLPLTCTTARFAVRVYLEYMWKCLYIRVLFKLVYSGGSVFVHHTCSRAELAPGVTPSGQRVLRGEEYGNAAITGWYSTTINMGFKSV